MPRITDIETDKTLYPLESSVLGYLPAFESGTTRALVTSVEAAAIVLEATVGIHNFAVNSPNYYLKWNDRKDRKQVHQYYEHMAAQRAA